jgi:hypothetical protein
MLRELFAAINYVCSAAERISQGLNYCNII